MKVFKFFLAFLCLIVFLPLKADENCQGRFINPLTDICWSCMFPLTLGSTPLYKGGNPDTKNPSDPICVCQKGEIPQVGLSVGFWEPARTAEVTRHPFCFTTLGGNVLNIHTGVDQGDVSAKIDGVYHSFYEVHWFIYPLLSWLNILNDTLCVEQGGFDVAYMSEFDPTWRDESLAFIFNPEAVLFSSLPAQAICGTDCVAATSHLPMDSQYWCAGCQGSMYPLTGFVASHVSNVQGSVLLAERMGFKLHRMGLEFATSGDKALCYNLPMPIMNKSQYRLQMTYPKAITGSPEGCNPFGRSTTLWESGKSYPTKGEDFGYLIWRKRNCCSM